MLYQGPCIKDICTRRGEGEGGGPKADIVREVAVNQFQIADKRMEGVQNPEKNVTDILYEWSLWWPGSP